MRVYRNKERSRWEAESTYAEKDIVKSAGFRWDPVLRMWWTNYDDKAVNLVNFAAGEDKAYLTGLHLKKEETLKSSRALDADIEIPAPEGLSYMPFQKAGIAFSQAHSRVLNGDEMGCGKTIQAIGLINSDPSINRVLVVCPASLKLNWAHEISRWLTRPLLVVVVKTGMDIDMSQNGVYIINYDITGKFGVRDLSYGLPFDLFVADECHLMKNRKTQRTKNLLGVRGTWDPAKKAWEGRIEGVQAKRVLFLSGTPLVNRPAELFPIVNYLDPKTFSSSTYFFNRYCGKSQTRYGTSYAGATNLEELSDKLRTSIMIRRLKKDVLRELPPKVRQVIPMDSCDVEAVAEEQKAVSNWEDILVETYAALEIAKASGDKFAYEMALEEVKERTKVMFTEIARVRHAVGVAKAEAVVPELKELVDEDETKKLVVFAHHHDVIDIVCNAFGDKAVKLTGEMSLADRDEAVRRFQNDPSVQVFVGSLKAAGVGLTLTASSHVIFLELDWVPGNMTQAEDRLHRIGQEAESVLIQHYVFEDSIDQRMVHALMEKQEWADKALDSNEEAKIPVTPFIEISGKSSRVQAEKKDLEIWITEEQKGQIHHGLKILAGCCDYANELDGQGFNKLDASIGHQLADRSSLTDGQAILGAKIIIKYHRQLPDEINLVARTVMSQKVEKEKTE